MNPAKAVIGIGRQVVTWQTKLTGSPPGRIRRARCFLPTRTGQASTISAQTHLRAQTLRPAPRVRAAPAAKNRTWHSAPMMTETPSARRARTCRIVRWLAATTWACPMQEQGTACGGASARGILVPTTYWTTMTAQTHLRAQTLRPAPARWMRWAR